jgi:PPOX class probable F420-dependent enzyme
VPQLAGPDARALFAGARTATLGSAGADGRPHLVPCVFAVDGDQVYSAVDGKPKSTRQLRRLANIAARSAVSLLADRYDEDWARLWWVRADGDAVVVDDPAAMAGPLRLLAARYPQYVADPPAGPVIAVTVSRWTGWSASLPPR